MATTYALCEGDVCTFIGIDADVPQLCLILECVQVLLQCVWGLDNSVAFCQYRCVVSTSLRSNPVTAVWMLSAENMEYTVGPSTLPWGTPASMALIDEVHPSVVTQKVRPSKKLFTSWNSLGVKIFFALCRSPGCHTRQKFV